MSYEIVVTETRTWRRTADSTDISGALSEASDIAAAVSRGDGRYWGAEFSESMSSTVTETS